MHEARTFEDIVRAIRARRKQMGVSQNELDDMAGLASGYVGKIEASLTNPTARNARSLGRESLPLLLEALRLTIVLVPACPKQASKNTSNSGALAPVARKKDVMHDRAQKGGRMRAFKLSAARRREIARKAGLASAKARKAMAPISDPA